MYFLAKQLAVGHNFGDIRWDWVVIQEAQLSQRDRASAAHYEYTTRVHLRVHPPSSSIWPHLSYGLVRSKREYYH